MAVPAWTRADVVTQFLGPNVSRDGNLGGYVGQALTIPAGSAFDNLTFNLYTDYTNPTPTASGTAYILSQIYDGLPTDLSTSTPGFLAESINTSGGLYSFDPGFVVQPGTTYYIYESSEILTFAFGETTNDYTNVLYFTNSPTSDYMSSGVNSAYFTLSGTQVPEPSTCAFVGFTGLTIFAVRRRRQA